MERRTLQRDILMSLIESAGHITIKEIIATLNDDFPSISVGTIYRNLETLEKEGFIRRIPTLYKEDIYESCKTKVHSHFICNQCHEIIDLKNKEEFKPFYLDNECLVEEKCLVYYGTCKECQKKYEC